MKHDVSHQFYKIKNVDSSVNIPQKAENWIWCADNAGKSCSRINEESAERFECLLLLCSSYYHQNCILIANTEMKPIVVKCSICHGYALQKRKYIISTLFDNFLKNLHFLGYHLQIRKENKSEAALQIWTSSWINEGVSEEII